MKHPIRTLLTVAALALAVLYVSSHRAAADDVAVDDPPVPAVDPYRDRYPSGLMVESRRLFDTRLGGPAEIVVTPRPRWATAVFVNVAVVDPELAGFATVYDCGALPDVSHVNWTEAGAVESNTVAAPLSPEGALCVYTSSPADVVVDLVAWTSTGYTLTLP